MRQGAKPGYKFLNLFQLASVCPIAGVDKHVAERDHWTMAVRVCGYHRAASLGFSTCTSMQTVPEMHTILTQPSGFEVVGSTGTNGTTVIPAAQRKYVPVASTGRTPELSYHGDAAAAPMALGEGADTGV